jgi:hypothetical protein
METTMTYADTEKALLSHRLPEKAIVLVLAGGRGSRLEQLTDRRAKPAVYFGGKFRFSAHRRRDPVQIALAAAPPAARLEFFAWQHT